jgi:hypothetical protein
MKIFWRSLKLFFAFLGLSFASLEVWDARKHSYDIPDKGLLVIAAIFAAGLTVLWMECRKD